MKFKENDQIVHKEGTEMIYTVYKAIGSDKIKEVYFGLWSTRKTTPSYSIDVEYVSINRNQLKNWEVMDEIR
jgi:hypothetical protein